MNLEGGASKAYFESDDATFLGDPLPGIVVTEDILSSVRVGRVLPSISTLGTSLHYNVAQHALNPCERVFIWYDGDEAGVRGATKAKKTLTMLGIPCSIVTTDKDPKEYNNEEIKDIIQAVLCGTHV